MSPKLWATLLAFAYLGALALLGAPLYLACFGPKDAGDIPKMYAEPAFWAAGAFLVICQSLLLIVPVARAKGRPVARRKLVVPAVVAGVLLCLLVAVGGFSLYLAIYGEDGNRGPQPDGWVFWVTFIPLPVLWAVWGAVFFAYRRTSDPDALLSRLMRWLLRGSVLEILVSIPSHVIVRRRDDCCAPMVTFAGIVTGLSVMLLSFGPGIFYLYARRFAELRPKAAPPESAASEDRAASP